MKQINHRRCVSCGIIAPKKSFWRIVRLANSNVIHLDRGIGRSAYLCPNVECFNKAKNKNRLSSSLRIKVPNNIYQNLQARLDR